jgi:hypothetical protein
MESAVLTLLLFLASTSAVVEESVQEEVVLPAEHRKALEAEFRNVAFVSEYLTRIKSPTRRVAAEALGLTPSDVDGSRLLVVGPLPDTDLKQLLLEEEIEEPISRVVADAKYARLYFCDPKEDTCCYAEWTYSKESGEWKRIFEYWRSH